VGGPEARGERVEEVRSRGGGGVHGGHRLLGSVRTIMGSPRGGINARRGFCHGQAGNGAEQRGSSRP
jgi:hypothetical protein